MWLLDLQRRFSWKWPQSGADRKLGDNPLQPDWGYAWPKNRRVMYNRASADPDGRPWSERKKLIWWNEDQKRWIGLDEPDFDPLKAPDYEPPVNATGLAALSGKQPFIMKPDGVGWLFAPGAAKDGPLPAHYEPVESPVGNLLYPKQLCNPTVRFFDGPLNRLAHTPTTEYPIVATTFRLTEHYLSGPMSRFNSWLNELQPEMFVELSPELAAESGIEHGGWLTVRSARSPIECASTRHPAIEAARDRRADCAPDRHPVSLGICRRNRRRQCERPHVARGRSECQHARV